MLTEPTLNTLGDLRYLSCRLPWRTRCSMWAMSRVDTACMLRSNTSRTAAWNCGRTSCGHGGNGDMYVCGRSVSGQLDALSAEDGRRRASQCGRGMMGPCDVDTMRWLESGRWVEKKRPGQAASECERGMWGRTGSHAIWTSHQGCAWVWGARRKRGSRRACWWDTCDTDRVPARNWYWESCVPTLREITYLRFVSNGAQETSVQAQHLLLQLAVPLERSRREAHVGVLRIAAQQVVFAARGGFSSGQLRTEHGSWSWSYCTATFMKKIHQLRAVPPSKKEEGTANARESCRNAIRTHQQASTPHTKPHPSR